ncbi:MAG TPA: hypothetical protein VF072_13165 [Thermoleophilaceae bacterium]
MRASLRALVVALAVAGAALAVPALASAETTFCINADAVCPPGGEDRADLQIALDQAADTADHDVILLGDKQTPYFGPFTYEPVALSKFNGVTIKGVGGRPSLTAGVGDTIITGHKASLERVDIFADLPEGLAADLDAGDLTDVKVTGPASFHPDLNGIAVTGPSKLDHVEIDGGYQTALTVKGGGLAGREVTAHGLTIQGPDEGIVLEQSADFQASRFRVDAVGAGIVSTGFVNIAAGVVTTSGPGSVGLLQPEPSEGNFELDHVTVAHVGQPNGNDSALLLRAAQPLDTRLHAVAISGYTRGFRRPFVNGAPPENVVITDSAWDPSHDELEHDTGVFVEQRNSHVAPDVVNVAGGDLHPRAGSSAIDRDQLTDLAQFTDLEGVAALDGDGDGIARPDAGAFEFRPAQPEPGTGGGNGAPAKDVSAPVLRKLRIVRRPKLRLAFTASEAATVKIVPQRIVRGRAAKARKPIVRHVSAGRGSVALARALRRAGLLRAGTVRLSVVATDAAGNRSPKRVLRLGIS